MPEEGEMFVSLKHPQKFVFAVLALGLAACNLRVESLPTAEDVSVAEEIRMVEGRFDLLKEKNRYVFSDMMRLEKIVASRKPDVAIHQLVDCVSDLRPSNVTLNGKAVVVGVVCYQALTQTVAHEETGPDSDIVLKWSGHISPIATPGELAAAKKAWQKVLREGTYSFH